MTFRALFFGTPDFAVPCLEALHDIAEVVGVVCQPDKPKGRGGHVSAPPVKEWAEAHDLTVVQPAKLRDGTFAQWVREQNVDVALVVAYGRILPKDVLEATRRGFVNVHASILPKYRGAAPITWAVVNGEHETGVTLMHMDEGMDTGNMLAVHTLPILEDETAGELSPRLAMLGALGVRAGLAKYVAGELPETVQDHAHMTMAPILKKEDGRIDFRKTARQVHDHVRGMSPWPGAFLHKGDKLIKVHEAKACNIHAAGKAPGTVIFAERDRVLVQCGEDSVDLLRVQLEGKKPVSGGDWVNGRGVAEGDVLGAGT